MLLAFHCWGSEDNLYGVLNLPRDTIMFSAKSPLVFSERVRDHLVRHWPEGAGVYRGVRLEAATAGERFRGVHEVLWGGGPLVEEWVIRGDDPPPPG